MDKRSKSGAASAGSRPGKGTGVAKGKGTGKAKGSRQRFELDARFKRMPRLQRTVKIDPRFQAIFDKNSSFASEHKIDARGRPVHTSSREEMHRLYHTEEDELLETKGKTAKASKNRRDQPAAATATAKKNKGKQAKKSKAASLEGNDGEDDEKGDDDEEEEEEEESEEEESEELVDESSEDEDEEDEEDEEERPRRATAIDPTLDFARGEVMMSSSDESDSDDDGVDAAPDADNDQETFFDVWGVNEDEVQIADATSARLAMCNMDWEHIRAADIFALAASFKPAAGVVKRVIIYPSEFGQEQMAIEEKSGPGAIMAAIKKAAQGEKAVEQNAGMGGENEDDFEANEEEEKEEEEEVAQDILRAYELQRLRYFFAVIECDSAATAAAIYEACDGVEFEGSANTVDLRFIPDDMTFEQEPKDTATEAPPPDAHEPAKFVTKALQQSKVELTWDQTAPERLAVTNRKLSKEDLKAIDLNAYIASASEDDEDSDSDSGEEKRPSKDSLKQKYKNLLSEIHEEEEAEKPPEELEITWDTGLKSAAEELVKRKEMEKLTANMTIGEKYRLEKKLAAQAQRREKRQAMRKKRREVGLMQGRDGADGESSDEEHPGMDDEFFNIDFGPEYEPAKTKKKDRGKDKGKAGKWREDRDLDGRDEGVDALAEGEDSQEDGKRHFDLVEMLKSNKEGKKGKKGKKKHAAAAAAADDFEVDVEDPRFRALANAEFAIDPTSSQFKFVRVEGQATKGMQKLLDVRRKGVAERSEADASARREQFEKARARKGKGRVGEGSQASKRQRR